MVDLETQIKIHRGHWLWNGPRDVYGRGKVYVDGKYHYVSRVLFGAARKRKMRKGERIQRTCEHPRCVNPDCWERVLKKRRVKPIGSPHIVCRWGHRGEWTANSQGRWVCKACARKNQADHYLRAQAALRP